LDDDAFLPKMSTSLKAGATLEVDWGWADPGWFDKQATPEDMLLFPKSDEDPQTAFIEW
jgi:hypothetical protein